MLRIVRLLNGYIKRQYLEWLSWRTFLLTLVLSQAAGPLIGLFVWSSALPGNAAVSTYYLLLLIAQLATVSYENHTLANGIYAGGLNHELLRPQPIIISYLGFNIAGRLTHILIGIPVIVIAALFTHLSLNVYDIFMALPALVLAAALRFLFMYTLALSAIWNQQAHSIVGSGTLLVFLLGGGVAPIPQFPEHQRRLIEILPFRAMLGFPVEIASGSLHGVEILSGYGWQLGWLLCFIIGTTLVWQLGLRRYTAIGG